MVRLLEIVQLENELGVGLPNEIVQRLGIKVGDLLYAVDTPTGIELTTLDPQFARQLKVAKRVMDEDRDSLRRLADS